MEIIGVILMIVFALVSAGDRKKKAAQKAEKLGMSGGAAMPKAAPAQRPANRMSLSEREARLDELKRKKAERAAAAANAPVMPSNAASSFESSLTELKQLLNVAQVPSAEGESMLADADCGGGSMPHSHSEGQSALEDEDCAGGSMPHSHTEGVSRTAQNRRLRQLDREEEDASGTPAGLVAKEIDAQALRRAVVMAEVLGRPKALKKSRFVA